MLVPVKLPNYLVVTDSIEIEIRQESEVFRFTALPRQVVPAPCNIASGLDGDTQQPELMSENSICFDNQIGRPRCIYERGKDRRWVGQKRKRRDFRDTFKRRRHDK